jgi:hypothetical protein
VIAPTNGRSLAVGDKLKSAAGSGGAAVGETRRERDQRPFDEPPSGESPGQRDQRNFAELLQELRVAGLGVQVLFGFLLALPFTVRFAHLDDAQRHLYLTALLLAALAIALLSAPVAYHRVIFRRRAKHQLLLAANVMALAGLVTVGLAISASIVLVVSYVAHGFPPALAAVATVAGFACLWFLPPILGRRRRG